MTTHDNAAPPPDWQPSTRTCDQGHTNPTNDCYRCCGWATRTGAACCAAPNVELSEVDPLVWAGDQA